jgi:hypothetical protein
MKKITFLGASVTGQKFDHLTGELTGYVEAFRAQHASRLGFSEVITHAWPGNRLSDAGMVCIHQMLAEKPDVAVIEPVLEDRSRGHDLSERHIHYFFQSCIEAGVLPIALALPMPGKKDPYSHPNYEILNSYCAPKNLPVIPVVIPPEISGESLYRDMVHTNRQGAEFYAGALSDALPGILSRGWSEIDVGPGEPVYNVREIPWDATGDFQSLQIRNLNLRPEASVGSFVLLQKQKIGCFSPIVSVAFEWLTKERSTYDFSIWDPHCYYERLSYVKIAEADQSDFSTIGLNISELYPKSRVSGCN